MPRCVACFAQGGVVLSGFPRTVEQAAYLLPQPEGGAPPRIRFDLLVRLCRPNLAQPLTQQSCCCHAT